MDVDIRDLEEAVRRSKDFDPNQPRDRQGRWTEVPGLDAGTEVASLYGGHAGTPDDPVPCGDDIERAAIVLGDGGNVTLNQPDQVATLLNELRDLVKDAEAKGEKAPTYDLCKVSVPGTNLFCQDNVRRPDGTKIDRVEMPQLSTKDPIPGSYADSLPRDKKGEVNLTTQFGEFLASRGDEPTRTTIPASHLRASQNELDGEKVAGIAGAVADGKIDVTDPKGAIYVTEDNYVIDGHHRWAAYVGEGLRTGEEIDMPVIVVHTDIGTALTLANFWTEEQGIPGADVTKKGIDGWLARTMIRVPEMADIIAKLADAPKHWDESKHPRDAEGQWTTHAGLDTQPYQLTTHVRQAHGAPFGTSYAQAVKIHKVGHNWSTPFGHAENLEPPKPGHPVDPNDPDQHTKPKKAFDPDLHPRDDRGRFAETPGGGNPLARAAVPPLPGMTEIPPGTARLFHITPLRNVDSIRINGLALQQARGTTYGEPNQIWATAGTNSQQARRVEEGDLMDSDFVVVEFWARPDELDIGRGVDPKDLEARASDVTLYGGVPADQIVAIHEPWHAAYRYLLEYSDEVKRGEYDWAAADNENYARAIDEIKKSKAFNPALHPRDDHGRFTEGAGGSSDIVGNPIANATTPANYRETWKPEMSPADGHAWAEAAGTQYNQTVVHMTTKKAVDGIVGQGFDTAEQAVHEAGRYFALRPEDAEFYDYKGNQAISAVVVTQNPLNLDWRTKEQIDQWANKGDFRRSALETAGYDMDDPQSVVDAISTDPTVRGELADMRAAIDAAEDPSRDVNLEDVARYVTDNPKVVTAALKAKGYDAVIIRPYWGPQDDPTTGGQQIVVFDREQAVVIGTEELPEPDFSIPFEETKPNFFERVQPQTYHDAEDEAIARAFAKDFDPNQPRDREGRWSRTPGLAGTVADSTPEGEKGHDRMVEVFDRYWDDAQFEKVPGAGWGDKAPALAKTENVVRIGHALAERAKKDPELKEQLEKVGQTIIDAKSNMRAAEEDLVPAMTIEDGVTVGEANGYQRDHLHLEPGMTLAEVGGREITAKLQDCWMQTASDSSALSWGLQLATSDRVGVVTALDSLRAAHRSAGGSFFSGGQSSKVGVGEVDYEGTFDLENEASAIAASPAVKAYVDEVYNQTQARLKRAGVTEITMQRGVQAETRAEAIPEGNQTVLMNPLSSWTLSESTAEEFGASQYGSILLATVPAERVFCIPLTGPGCLREQEFLVAGGESEVQVRDYGRPFQGYGYGDVGEQDY